MRLLKALFQSPAAGSIARGGYAVVKNQPVAAPILAGSSVAAALGMILMGGYTMLDCIRFQTEHRQCDDSVRQDGGMLVAGVVMLAGNWGFFNTYNKKLHAEEIVSPLLDTRELVDNFPVEAAFDAPEPTREELERYLSAPGVTQQDAARFFGITRYRVRKILGKEEGRKNDRGR